MLNAHTAKSGKFDIEVKMFPSGNAEADSRGAIARGANVSPGDRSDWLCADDPNAFPEPVASPKVPLGVTIAGSIIACSAFWAAAFVVLKSLF